MPLTREQKILGGVLALAGVALGYDRLFLLGSTDAVSPAAGMSPATGADGGLANGAALPGPIPSAQATFSTLDRRFSDIAATFNIDPEGVGDAYASDAEWAQKPIPVETNPDVPEAEITPEQRIEAFMAGHKLTAVMHTGGADFAVINGELYAPGRTIGDFQLMEVTSHAAVFRYGEHRFELALPGEKKSTDND